MAEPHAVAGNDHYFMCLCGDHEAHIAAAERAAELRKQTTTKIGNNDEGVVCIKKSEEFGVASDEELRRLGDALRTNTTLWGLTLAFVQNVGSEELEVFVQSVRENGTLTTLGFPLHPRFVHLPLVELARIRIDIRDILKRNKHNAARRALPLKYRCFEVVRANMSNAELADTVPEIIVTQSRKWLRDNRLY